jgi:plasmid stabilization system protein ParE
MRVRYSPRAFADRQAIFAYIEERSPQGARNVKRAIVNAIRLLGSHPHMAPPTDVPGVRELSVPRRPYKVYYRIERTEIWIVHIRDARRKPWQGGG